MLVRHPYLSAFAVVYLVGVFAVSLTPGASSRLGFVGGILLLIPSGAILAVLLGNHRLGAAILLGITVCVWLELGRTAWFGSSETPLMNVTANMIGALTGVALTSTFIALRGRTRRRQ
jgi:glycopeptide antibiotics resistance protein